MVLVSWDGRWIRDVDADLRPLASDSDAVVAWSTLAALLSACLECDRDCDIEVWAAGPDDLQPWGELLRREGMTVKEPRNRWDLEVRATGKLTPGVVEIVASSDFDYVEVRSRDGGPMLKTLGTMEAFDVPFLSETRSEGVHALVLPHATFHFAPR